MIDFLTTAQAAALLGKTQRRIQQMCQEKRLIFQWFGNRLMVDRASVEAYASKKGEGDGNLGRG